MKITPLEQWIAEKTGIDGRPEPSRLRAYQLERLRDTLRLVKAKSRFYGERLAGVNPDDIVTMDDVSRLPFTTPEDITARPTDFLCVRPYEISRIVTLSTSGTTGPPKRLYFTPEDQELTVDFFHRGMTTLADTGDAVIIFMPGTTTGSVGDLLRRGLSRFGCRSVVYGPIRDYADAYAALFRERANCIVGIPSQILTLSRSGAAEGKPALKSLLLSADYVPAAAVSWLEEVWGAPVFEHYGMTEMGYGGGVACRARNGYHLREADLLFEIVDPAGGRPVPDGVFGEAVFSTLTRTGMPLIRYRTGDRARFLTEPCPCGSVLRRLDRVSGRFSDAVTLPDGQTLTIAQLDESILHVPEIAAFSAELTTQDGCDRLIITVAASGASHFEDILRQRLSPLLGDSLRDGRLRLEIRRGDVGFFTTGALKRRIADNRSA